MNAYRASILLAAASALTLGACKPNLTTQPYSQANLDFTRYVAVGNSLTAGYADNSLYRSGQIASYPAMLSWSFSRFGPSDYKAPLLPGESGWPSPKLVLGLSPDLMGNVSLGPVPYPNQTDTVGSSINIAAPTIKAATTSPRVIRFATFCSPSTSTNSSIASTLKRSSLFALSRYNT